VSADKVVVVGAGVGGLVSAALLAARGLDVTVVEAEAGPGGKLRAIGGIDAGPTVFTMRHVFDRIFAEAGGSFAEAVTLAPARTLARHAWGDSSSLDLFADPAESEAAIGTFAGAREARGYRAFRTEAKRIHDALDHPFLRASKTDPLTLGWRMGAKGFADYCSLRPYESLWRALGGYFHDPRLRQLFARYSTYCGSSPFKTPATLMLIAHVEASGVWLVDGGMVKLAQALESLARNAGAQFRYGERVEQILVTSGRASSVVLSNGERLSADRVIANADAGALGAGFLGPDVRRATRPMAKAKRSLSALVWLASGRASGLPMVRHNVFFSGDYKAEFGAIAAGQLAPDPSIYVCAQDRAEADAPPGPERFQIIVNAPANGDTHIYTSQEIETCQSHMLARAAQCGVALTLDSPRVLTPNDFERLCPSTGGALYGRASHGWAASFLRPGTRTRIAGLYLAGGSTHPGAGVPMAALSGRLASESLLSDLALTATSRRAGIAGGMSTRSAQTVATG